MPDIEINLSKQPIALMIYPHGIIVPYKITPKDEFFVLNEPRAVGVYFINDKYRYMWNGRTPVYIYAVGNFTPIDPVKINGLNLFKKQNKLVRMGQKDIRHGSMIRHLMNRIDKSQIKGVIDQQMEEEGAKIENAMKYAIEDMKKNEQFMEEKHSTSIKKSPEQKAVIIVNYLKQLDLIDEKEQNNLIFNIENSKLSFEALITELRQRKIVSVAEPLAEDLEDFLQDLQQQDESNLASFVQDHRTIRGGVKKYKQPIIKQWISSFVIAGIIIAGTVMPWILAEIGFIHLPDPRLMGIGFLVLIIVMARYHFPFGIPPVALVFYPNKSIIAYKIKSKRIFLLNDIGFQAVYSLNNSLRLMWNGKIACYLFEAKKDEKVPEILELTQPLAKKRFQK